MRSKLQGITTTLKIFLQGNRSFDVGRVGTPFRQHFDDLLTPVLRVDHGLLGAWKSAMRIRQPVVTTIDVDEPVKVAA